MYMDIEEKLAAKRNLPFAAKFIKGLPIGLEMSNGVVIGHEN
jgi:salicylate hydroxylase